MEGLDKIFVVIGMLMGILITPLFFILMDLWAGYRKAKQRKEPILSDKLQRTIAKIARYYNALLALVVIDALQISTFWYLEVYYSWHFPLFPFITLAGAIGVALIEVKSIMEKADEKAKRDMRQVSALASEIAKHRSEPAEIAQEIIKYLHQDERNSKDLKDL